MAEPHKPITKWAPIVGRWSFGDHQVTYLGPQQAQLPYPYGICISNARFSEGDAKVTVSLGEQSTSAGKKLTEARVLLGYRSLDEIYMMIGLGGWDRAYTIGQFEPGRAWRALAVAGSSENLSSNKQYQLAVRLIGQRISLSVDDVRVLDHVLDEPLPEGQLSLFAWGEQSTTFQDVYVRDQPGTAFVIMQFSNIYQELYEDVIKPTIQKFNLNAYYAGEVFRPGIILEDIVRGIVTAKS